MGRIAHICHGGDVGFGFFDGCFKPRSRAELATRHPLASVLTGGGAGRQRVQQTVTAERSGTVKPRAGCVACGVKSGEPPCPRTDDASPVSVDGQTADGVTYGGFERQSLSVHVNARPLLNKSEERPPPGCALAHVPSVEHRLNGGADGSGNVQHGSPVGFDGCTGGFVQRCTVKHEPGGQEDVGAFDGQGMMRDELHVSQSDPGSEGHVHAQTDHARVEGAFEAFVGDDQSFALQADDTAVDHVERNNSVHRLLGVNERQRNLIAATDDAVTHALFLTDLLEAGCGSAAGIGGPGLLMACSSPDDGETLLISAEIQTPALQKVHLLDGTSGGFGDEVLVAEERPATYGVLAVAAVVRLLKRGGQTVQSGHAGGAQTGGRHHQRGRTGFGRFGSGVQRSGPVADDNNIPCFHSLTPPVLPKWRTAIRCALLPSGKHGWVPVDCDPFTLWEEVDLPTYGRAPDVDFYVEFGSQMRA